MVTKVKKRRMRGGKTIKREGHRDLHAPALDHDERRRAAAAVVRHRRPRPAPTRAMTRLLTDIRTDVETGTSLSAGVPQVSRSTSTRCTATWSRPAKPAVSWKTLLDRLAIYKEKTMAIKSKIKSALIYPIAVIVVAFVVLAVIMIFVIPAFKDVFKSLRRRPAGADAGRDGDVEVLRRLLVSDLRRSSAAASTSSCSRGSARSRCRSFMDRLLLSCRSSATWSTSRRSRAGRARSSTMFAAGVPLVEALDSVGGAVGQLRSSPKPPRRSRRTSRPARPDRRR